jgi:hypothetical protein
MKDNLHKIRKLNNNVKFLALRQLWEFIKRSVRFQKPKKPNIVLILSSKIIFIESLKTKRVVLSKKWIFT